MRTTAASLIIAAAIIVAASLDVFVASAHQAPTALFCVLVRGIAARRAGRDLAPPTDVQPLHNWAPIAAGGEGSAHA